MTFSRNTILIVGLTLFLLWYVSSWAYQTQFSEPRLKLGNKISQLSKEIEWGRNQYAMMEQFYKQTYGFYYRSLPRVSNDARSQYSFWLLELLQYSGFENNRINDNSRTLIPLGADYRFSVQCTGSLSQLSQFLFEFYYAPFLHRIATMTLVPIEGNADKLSLSMIISVLALQPRQTNDPYPTMNQIPTGWYPRLASNDPASYQVVAERNLLQTAKGGIDRAEYAFLTAIIHFDNQKEVWFSVRTDDSIIKARLGDSISVGSFSGKIVEIFDQDIVLDRGGTRWLLTTGESLKEAFALPPETVGKDD